MAAQPHYGTGYFVMKQGATTVASGSGLSYELDMSDRETVTASNTALDGTKHTKRKGQYINPRIIIFYPASDLQTGYNNLLGEIVTFFPHVENTSFYFDCTVIDVYPEFDENCPSLINLIVELEAAKYVTYAPYNIEQQQQN